MNVNVCDIQIKQIEILLECFLVRLQNIYFDIWRISTIFLFHSLFQIFEESKTEKKKNKCRFLEVKVQAIEEK